MPDRWLGEIPCAVYVPTVDGDPRALADEAAARSAIAEDTPRWWLARREFPRGPTHKLRRGLLAREAARWTAAFPQLIAPTHRRYPAYDLEGGLAIVDGCPWAGGGALDPCARAIPLATRRPAAPRAVAALVPGPAGLPACFVVGPVAAEPDAELEDFAGELVRLAGLVPGPTPAAICAFGDRATFAAAGLVAMPGAPGWTWRRDAAIDEAALRAALPDVARAIDVVAAWAHKA